jgi:hypothetical protein
MSTDSSNLQNKVFFGFCGIFYCFWFLWDFLLFLVLLCELTGRLRYRIV